MTKRQKPNLKVRLCLTSKMGKYKNFKVISCDLSSSSEEESDSDSEDLIVQKNVNGRCNSINILNKKKRIMDLKEEAKVKEVIEPNSG